MKNTAIVAIPKEDDYVWNISSEKVPHLTLLFLGDQSNNPRLEEMTEYLQHVVETSLHRFGLSVDRRGKLGDKDADVLFFDKDFLEKEIEVARTALLRNSDFFLAYNSTTQFEGWTPHLTLGFPETPAKKDNRPYGGIGWVDFDKIALWTEDYDGPTFTLERRESLNPELAMSGLKGGAVKTLDELRHYGVKGQKWGVIRDRSSAAVSAGKNEIALRKASEVTVRPKASGGVKTVGGKGRPASDDAKDAAVKKQVATKSTVHALSNQELQSLVTRMNLEQQFVRLQKSDPDSNRAKKFIDKLLGKKDKEIKMNDLDSTLADTVGSYLKKKSG